MSEIAGHGGFTPTIQPFTRDMWRTYYHWRRDHKVMYWATREAHQSSLAPEEAFMRGVDQAILTDRHQESGILGIIAESGLFIGEVSYRDMDLVAGTAVLGIMMGTSPIGAKATDSMPFPFRSVSITPDSTGYLGWQRAGHQILRQGGIPD